MSYPTHWYLFIIDSITYAGGCCNQLLLLLSGDVETNPGMTKAQEAQLESVLAIVRNLKEGQNEVLSELKKLREDQSRTESAVTALTKRVANVEACVSSLDEIRKDAESTKISLKSMTEQIHTLESRCEDAENRMRRSNLVFYGHADKQNETWAQSEKLVLDMCSRNLGLSLQSSFVERAHRLGRFNNNKTRPIIVKLSSTKHKDGILSACYKLKNTGFAVSEDFSPAVREARRKLIEFAKQQGKQYKLRSNRLVIDNKTFCFDSAKNSIYEEKKP